jgi:hypothetical protein
MIQGGKVPVAKRVLDVPAISGRKQQGGMNPVICDVDGRRLGDPGLGINRRDASRGHAREQQDGNDFHHAHNPTPI